MSCFASQWLVTNGPGMFVEVYDHFNNLCRENAISVVRAFRQAEQQCSLFWKRCDSLWLRRYWHWFHDFLFGYAERHWRHLLNLSNMTWISLTLGKKLASLGHKETQPVAENIHASVAHVAEWWGLTSDAFIVDQQKPAPWVFWTTNRSRCGNSFEVYLCKTSQSNPSYTFYCHCLQISCLLKLRIIHRCICRNGFPCALIIWAVFCCYLCPGSQFRGVLVWKITTALELPVEHMHTVKV